MFQLNSYKISTHFRWMRSNTKKLLPCFIGSVVICVLAMSEWSSNLVLAILSVLFIILTIGQIPRKKKKALVFTNRVIRLIVTVAAICMVAVIFVTSKCVTTSGKLVGIAILTFACPFAVLLANTINKPLELAINQYYINDAKKILQACPELLTIGVTGSYGKTSVKYFLQILLSGEYESLMTPESYNTPMGVVKTVRGMLRATHQVFVCEMGARRVGDIKELCDIVHPKLGIITSVGPQHLETFHTIENVRKTKFELADSLPQEGILFLNLESENIKNYKRANCRVIGYGLSKDCDYYATDISVSSKGTQFTVCSPLGNRETFSTKLIGFHNVINITGAIAVCNTLGISLSALKAQVRKLECVPHRLQLIRRHGLTIIDDAYNSNPAGSKAALDVLSLFDGYRILVTPGMVELGESQERLNREFGVFSAAVCDYVILVGKKQTQSIYEGLLSKDYDRERIYVAEDLQDALTRAYAVQSEGREKIILLENDLPDNF